jgi:hypothetical protein
MALYPTMLCIPYYQRYKIGQIYKNFEKSFRFLKSTLSVQPVRHWLFRRVKAYIFICYLAYLHLAWMKMLLEKGGISLSPIKALELLETIYTVELTDTHTEMSTKRTVPLTKEQEDIYKALHLLS